MFIRKTKELEDIEVNELSLVDKPANNQKFLFFKSEENDMKKEQALEIISEYADDFPQDLQTAIETLSGESIEKSDEDEEL